MFVVYFNYNQTKKINIFDSKKSNKTTLNNIFSCKNIK